MKDGLIIFIVMVAGLTFMAFAMVAVLLMQGMI